MIKILKNPKTDSYVRLKNQILGGKFPWYFNPFSAPGIEETENHKNISYFKHNFLDRPEQQFGFPTVLSNGLAEQLSCTINDILKENNINLITFLRICANLTFPYQKVTNCIAHYDHFYNHKNLLIYLTDSGGKTIVEGEEHDPKEDDVIMFQGKHYQQTPKEKERIVIVVTFIDSELLNHNQ